MNGTRVEHARKHRGASGSLKGHFIHDLIYGNVSMYLKVLTEGFFVHLRTLRLNFAMNRRIVVGGCDLPDNWQLYCSDSDGRHASVIAPNMFCA
jgi:hypothetical protein